MRRRLRAPADDAPALIAAVLAGVWLVLELRTPDLAAQTYRAGLFDRHGLAVWDNYWYAGHHLPGYSLVFPPLGALVGTRILGALSAVVSALLFRRAAFAVWGSRARAGTVWFGVATVGDLMIGRLTYSLGVTVALAAVLAVLRKRPRVAAALAALCSAVSPVAGLFLALAGAAAVAARLTDRDAPGGEPRRRGAATLSDGWVLAAPALATAGAMAIAFPEGGRQPFSQSAFYGALAYTAPLLVLLARRSRSERTLVTGVALYLLAVVAAKLFDTPMGGNVSRLSALFAGPLALCALYGRWPQPGFCGRHARAAGLGASAVALAALAVFQFNSPIREAAKGYGDRSLHASYFKPVLAFMRSHPRPVGRLEVPFTLSHWDAAFLAREVPLARGWERQLDTSRDPLFYSRPFTAAKYERWLEQVGVRFVALPDVRLDPSSRREAALIAAGLPFLRLALRTAHWQIFEFTHARPLADGAATVTTLGAQDVTLAVARPGPIRLLVHFTAYWRVAGGRGCVQRAPGGGDWTLVQAARPGRLRIAASFSIDRVFDHSRRCA